MYFKAERDKAVIIIPVMISIIAIFSLQKINIILIVILAILNMFIIVNMCTLKYKLSDKELMIQSFWGKKTFDLYTINKIKMIKGGYSMSSSSGKQIALYSDELKLVSVSPADVALFENEIMKRIKVG